MDIKKTYGTDKEKEKKGVWEDLGDGARVLVARIGNPNYRKIFEQLTKPYSKSIRRGTLSEEKATELIIKSLAKSVLLGWEGLKEDGKLLKHSEAEAIRLMTEYPDFRDQVQEIANDLETYKIVEDEDTEKNSGKSSAGT